MLASRVNLMTLSSEPAESLLVTLDHDPEVSVLGDRVLLPHQMNLLSGALEPHRTAADSFGSGDLLEPQQRVESDAFLEPGRRNLAGDVLDYRQGNSQIAEFGATATPPLARTGQNARPGPLDAV
jgi:hypothetical protein